MRMGRGKRQLPASALASAPAPRRAAILACPCPPPSRWGDAPLSPAPVPPPRASCPMSRPPPTSRPLPPLRCYPAREATLSLSYPAESPTSTCFTLQQWSACATYSTVSNVKASETVRLPNEHIAWVRKHAGALKGIVALNKALDPEYNFKAPPAGTC
jgi:hypothetical protein